MEQSEKWKGDQYRTEINSKSLWYVNKAQLRSAGCIK